MGPVMKKLLPLALTLALTSLPTFAATKISGSMKVLSATTLEPITSARVGQQIKLKIIVNDLDLIANKKVTFTYALSVLPEGASTPTTISGKLSGPFTLPSTEGGAKKTKTEMAGLAGKQSVSGLIEIPDFMPEGKATISVSIAGSDVGSINLSKTLTIKL